MIHQAGGMIRSTGTMFRKSWMYKVHEFTKQTTRSMRITIVLDNM